MVSLQLHFERSDTRASISHPLLAHSKLARMLSTEGSNVPVVTVPASVAADTMVVDSTIAMADMEDAPIVVLRQVHDEWNDRNVSIDEKVHAIMARFILPMKAVADFIAFDDKYMATFLHGGKPHQQFYAMFTSPQLFFAGYKTRLTELNPRVADTCVASDGSWKNYSPAAVTSCFSFPSPPAGTKMMHDDPVGSWWSALPHCARLFLEAVPSTEQSGFCNAGSFPQAAVDRYSEWVRERFGAEVSDTINKPSDVDIFSYGFGPCGATAAVDKGIAAIRNAGYEFAKILTTGNALTLYVLNVDGTVTILQCVSFLSTSLYKVLKRFDQSGCMALGYWDHLLRGPRMFCTADFLESLRQRAFLVRGQMWSERSYERLLKYHCKGFQPLVPGVQAARVQAALLGVPYNSLSDGVVALFQVIEAVKELRIEERGWFNPATPLNMAEVARARFNITGSNPTAETYGSYGSRTVKPFWAYSGSVYTEVPQPHRSNMLAEHGAFSVLSQDEIYNFWTTTSFPRLSAQLEDVMPAGP